MGHGRGESWDRLQRELVDEKAAALARIGRGLQDALEELERVRGELERADPMTRARLVDGYRALWRRAARYRWYLEVQREAVGLRTHDRLDDAYPFPPPPA